MNDIDLLAKVVNKEHFVFADVFFGSGLSSEEISESLERLEKDNLIYKCVHEGREGWKVIKTGDIRHHPMTLPTLLMFGFVIYLVLKWTI